MTNEPHEYHRPIDIKSASTLLRRQDIDTAPLYMGPYPTSLHQCSSEAVVDLTALNLEYIGVSDDGGFHIGALTTLQQLLESNLMQSHANGLLSQASLLAAHHGLRNLANLAGVLTTHQGPQEVLLALLVLDAVVVLDDGSDVEVQAFSSTESNGRFITEIRIPNHTVVAALERISRSPLDKSIVSVAAALHLDDDVVTHARLAVTGVLDKPQRVEAVEQLIINQPYGDTVDEALMTEINPVSDYRGSSDYRRAMVGVLAHRAVTLAHRNREVTTGGT